MNVDSNFVVTTMGFLLLILSSAHGKLADRGRLVKARQERSDASKTMNSRVLGVHTNKIKKRELPLEGPKYRGKDRYAHHNHLVETSSTERELSSQLTGCCTTWSAYTSAQLCSLYGQDCDTGQEPSHDSGDESCEMAGLSFIGVSFSVNTAMGNPHSYQLCDQFPMENIIDRNYDYVMSMDEDGWLVGGGYKSFDYSGKMPYIDSSHTELLRIGSLDPSYGGTTIEQVYSAMQSVKFPPFAIFPEFVKSGGKHGSSDDKDGSVPSGDVTLIVSVVETYEDGDNYSLYEKFLNDLFEAMDAVNGGPCMDDHDTDPHVSMSRGVKFKSSYHEQQYFWKANLEVAVWQAMYPKGVVIGSSGKANFPPNMASHNQEYVGYGNLYFFFDRANITKAFRPYRELSSSQDYYSKLWENGGSSTFYSSVTTVDFDYSGSGSGSGDNQYYEHNPYGWNAKMAKHDMTDGWDLPPNCDQEGETFFGIPLSVASSSKLQSTSSFQNQFDFEYVIDRNYTYMKEFGTNHGWLVGEILNNGPGSIVDKDTAHIPLFYTGTTNPEMGGISLSNLIKIAKNIDFGTLYIKPAFIFQDDDGSIKVQFEADSSSALAYLYDNLCSMIGITWNYNSPSNDLGVYTNCAMHAAGDRAKYGCGPENANTGGFCPQMTLAYRVAFQSEEHAEEYLYRANIYIDYWRKLYPSGVAVGTDKFCPDGGCLGLFLNRFDLYQVFKPGLGGSWVEYNGGTFAPTISPAPTTVGGCDDPLNKHLDKCFRRSHSKLKSTGAAWEALGSVGQLSVYMVAFMATTLAISVFLARAKKRRKTGETYFGFFVRDMKRKKRKKKLRRRIENTDLEADMLGPEKKERGRSSRSRSVSRKRESRSRSRRASSRPREEEEDKSRHSSRSGRIDRTGRSRSRSKKARDKSNSRSRRDKERYGKSVEKKSNRRQLV